MRKYYKSSTRRPYADFPLVKDARIDKRYYGSSLTNYYTEERGEIRERWFPIHACDNEADKKCFAVIRRCYALGMLIVNGIDLRSAYSCLRANPSLSTLLALTTHFLYSRYSVFISILPVSVDSLA